MLDNIRERSVVQLAELSDSSSNAYLARRRRLHEVMNANVLDSEAYMSVGETPMIANVDGVGQARRQPPGYSQR